MDPSEMSMPKWNTADASELEAMADKIGCTDYETAAENSPGPNGTLVWGKCEVDGLGVHIYQFDSEEDYAKYAKQFSIDPESEDGDERQPRVGLISVQAAGGQSPTEAAELREAVLR